MTSGKPTRNDGFRWQPDGHQAENTGLTPLLGVRTERGREVAMGNGNGEGPSPLRNGATTFGRREDRGRRGALAAPEWGGYVWSPEDRGRRGALAAPESSGEGKKRCGSKADRCRPPIGFGGWGKCPVPGAETCFFNGRIPGDPSPPSAIPPRRLRRPSPRDPAVDLRRGCAPGCGSMPIPVPRRALIRPLLQPTDGTG